MLMIGRSHSPFLIFEFQWAVHFVTFYSSNHIGVYVERGFPAEQADGHASRHPDIRQVVQVVFARVHSVATISSITTDFRVLSGYAMATVGRVVCISVDICISASIALHRALLGQAE